MTIEDTIRQLVAQAVRDELAKLATRPTELMSTKEAAARANVGQATIRRWVRSGKLRAQHAGRVVRVDPVDLEQMLASGSPRNDSANPEQLARRKYG